MKEMVRDVEINNIVQGLAKEINSMTAEEKLITLERIVRAELKGAQNHFWTLIAKKMLIDDETTNKVLSDKIWNCEEKNKKAVAA